MVPKNNSDATGSTVAAKKQVIKSPIKPYSISNIISIKKPAYTGFPKLT
jgi:hypothetical protein